MSMNLYQAHNQWANRPSDERFWSISEAYRSQMEIKRNSTELSIAMRDIRVEARGDDLRIAGKSDIQANMSHFAFGQLARKLSVPADYMRSLPATLAAQNLNYALKSQENDKDSNILYVQDGGIMTARAMTSDRYARVWNADILSNLQVLEGKGWQLPPARPCGIEGERTRKATEADVLRLRGNSGLSVNVGDNIAPAGMYASDHDMFCFMVNEDKLIEDGKGNRLGRGFFIWNSEVGEKSLGVIMFLYAYVCGNHIVWNAQGVTELRMRHMGEIHKRFGDVSKELHKISDRPASEDESAIKMLQSRVIEVGPKDVVIDATYSVVKSKGIQIGKKEISQAYDIADTKGIYGPPNTFWGLANGLTELSQRTEYADERVKLDVASGRLMRLAA